MKKGYPLSYDQFLLQNDFQYHSPNLKIHYRDFELQLKKIDSQNLISFDHL